MIFEDRFEAGKLLAEKLQDYKNDKRAIILAIPRGALQIGSVLARELHLPLDVVLTKKIGYPRDPEYAIGAVSMTDQIMDKALLESGEVSQDYIDEQTQKIRSALKARHRQYHGEEPPLDLKGKTVIITDDGAATGRTVVVAIDLARQQKPKKIIVALPVAHPDALDLIRKKADEVICLHEAPDLFAIGQFYENFEQVEDEEAIRLLKEAKS